MDNTIKENIVNENVDSKVKAGNMPKGDGISFKKYGLVSLIFAIVYTICLYGNRSSITYPIFMAITLGLIALVRKSDNLPFLKDRNGKVGFNLFYVISLMLLAVSKCMFTSYSLQNLSGLAIVLLFMSFIMQLYADTTGWDIAGWICGIFFTIVRPIEYFPWPFRDFAIWVKDRGSETSKERKNALMAVGLGIIIAIPLLAVVISLLISADAVFSRVLEKAFSEIHLPDNIGDILGIAWTLFAAFVCAYTIPNSLNKKNINISPAKQGNNNPLIAITFTILLGIVYLFFCLIQVLFLFTDSMKLPTGYTYAEYAHEGFYQLLAVCMINVALVLVCSRAFAKNKLLTVILSVIGACTYIMVASSAMRMILYIQAFQLTFLRVFVLWFLCVLSLWLAFLIVSMYKSTFPVFKAAMVTITVAYIIFAFANPDYQIAKYDLAHVQAYVDESENVAEYITGNLSPDAAPALKGNKKLMKDFEDEVRYTYPKENYEGIRKFNISYARAKALFEEN
ncbi:DUF4153 domain-containing protein [Pseudobutyrivibrio ruminis]|uniref:DUF4153 domain-containing protein n=1 Tax=Pseudobutyrivibrio ruminis TaxID=46206 RepID=UPI00041996A6|nr:DUF4173 domain-containing protein [Pseudobutyrivibrio ruminis]